MPDSPPQVIHMPLEDLIDPDLNFDCPESAGENPTAYILKSDVDKMAEALNAAREYVDWHAGLDSPTDDEGWPLDDAACTLKEVDDALAAYREAKG